MDSNNHESLESEMEEGHNPLTAVADSIASVKAASEIGKKQPLRKGDKQNSQSMEKAAGATMAKEDVEGTFEEDLAALVESEATLSEGFRAKAEVIFEAALSSKLSEHVERLEEQYETQLSEEVTRIQEELVEKVDGYLGYVVESWMDENKLAIENGLRTEIAESFMSALHGVFTEHYIQVPEEKADLVDGLADKIGELEEQLNRTVQDNIDLVESVKTYARQSVISELAKDLSEAQAEKLKALVEDISFESEDTFAQKVETIKESYFKKASVQTQAEEELLDENTKEVQVSPMMQQYLNALKK
jgi:methylphosphotriester-DNA--protein-cysteine methyltransferase